MDLRLYYHNLRKAEEEITDEFVVLMSEATPDGGKSGRMTEVPIATMPRRPLSTDGRGWRLLKKRRDSTRRPPARGAQQNKLLLRQNCR